MKKFLPYLLLVLLLGVLLFWILSQKPLKSAAPTPVASLTVEELYRQFYEDENLANEKYLNKTLRITGALMDAYTDDTGFGTVVLEGGKARALARMHRGFDIGQLKLERGDNLTVICTCMGLMNDLDLRDCQVE